MLPQDFIDYYEVMQISPNAELETVQRVYRMLAARYHPDNPHSGDTAKFVLLNEAYHVLSDSVARQAYDRQYQNRAAQPMEVFQLREFTDGADGERNRRMGILCLLYNRRRINPEAAGVSILELERNMDFPREHLLFSVWYLKEKMYIRQDERTSDLLITGSGVDFVEERLPNDRVMHKLLLAAESGAAWTGTDREAAGGLAAFGGNQ
jgi:curved DNA-binding protein CbpA